MRKWVASVTTGVLLRRERTSANGQEFDRLRGWVNSLSTCIKSNRVVAPTGRDQGAHGRTHVLEANGGGAYSARETTCEGPEA